MGELEYVSGCFALKSGLMSHQGQEPKCIRHCWTPVGTVLLTVQVVTVIDSYFSI